MDIGKEIETIEVVPTEVPETTELPEPTPVETPVETPAEVEV